MLSIRRPWAPHVVAISLLAVTAIGAVQSLSLPAEMIAWIAPGSAAAYRSASITQFDLSAATHDSSAPSSHSISASVSLASYLTKNSAAFTLVVAVFAFVASTVFDTRLRLSLLLGSLAFAGAAVGVMGLLQMASDPAATFWGIRSFQGGYPFGPFVNRSSAAVLMNLGLASGIGLIAWRLAALTSANLDEHVFPLSELLDVLADRITFTAVLMSLLCAAGLVASGSRGGVAGTVVGSLVAFGFAGSPLRRRNVIGIMIGICLIAAFLLVKWEIPTASVDRLTDTELNPLNVRMIDDGRWSHWPDGWRAAIAQPVLGWGLGAYRYAYLPFQQSGGGDWFINADNLWLECFVETGLIGMFLLAATVLALVRAIRRLGTSPDPMDHGIYIAAWFALGSLATSQFFDFGLRIPANALAAATLFSVVMSRSYFVGSDDPMHPSKQPLANPVRTKSAGSIAQQGLRQQTVNNYDEVPNIGYALGLLSLFGVLLGLAAQQLAMSAQGDYAVRLCKSMFRDHPLDLVIVNDRSRQLQDHLNNYPLDDAGWCVLADVEIEKTRLAAAYAISTDPSTEAWQQVYNSLQPVNLRSVWYKSHREQGADDSVAAVPRPLFPSTEYSQPTNPPQPPDESAPPQSNSPLEIQIGASLHQARNYFEHARLVCPQSDEPIRGLIKLDFAGGSPQQSEILTRDLMQLRGRHAPTVKLAGDIAAQSGDWENAAEAYQLAITLKPDLVYGILRSIPTDSSVSISSLIPNQPEALSIAASLELDKLEPDAALLDRAAQVLKRSLPLDSLAQMQQLRLVARIQSKRGQFDQAAQTLGMAVGVKPADCDSRVQWVVALQKAGKFAEARQQARAGRQIAPQDARFDKLIAELTPTP